MVVCFFFVLIIISEFENKFAWKEALRGHFAHEGRSGIRLHHRIYSCQIGVSMALEVKLSCT